ncbi:MAG TPA: nucleoside-diphosphate kinase [Tepidisphaeraceae bacterium]|nr:nucleoside-diphosphate kinase [Tepidisphaeraceae bacterium]
MAVERSLIILKPDAVKRKLCGEIIRRIENKGLNIVGMKLATIPVATAEKHYAEHAGKGFFKDLVSFMTGSPVVLMAVEGDDSIVVLRGLIGKTKFTEATPGTIRGDYAFSFTENLVHGSDSPESAKREIALFFPELK